MPHQREQTRHRIVESAARWIRTEGIAGTSLAAVMDGVGLTVGGFYAYFPSKEALLAEALRLSAEDARAAFADACVPPREAILGYLSAAHRDHPERGCPLPTIVAETGPDRPLLQRALVEVVEALAGSLDTSCPLARVSLMIGAVSLARALAGTALSDAVLDEARKLIDASA